MDHRQHHHAQHPSQQQQNHQPPHQQPNHHHTQNHISYPHHISNNNHPQHGHGQGYGHGPPPSQIQQQQQGHGQMGQMMNHHPQRTYYPPPPAPSSMQQQQQQQQQQHLPPLPSDRHHPGPGNHSGSASRGHQPPRLPLHQSDDARSDSQSMSPAPNDNDDIDDDDDDRLNDSNDMLRGSSSQSQHHASGQSGSAAGQGRGSRQGQVTKRTRASKACDTCRRKRTKCSGEYPCSGCKAFGFSCHYSITTKRRGPVRKNTIKTLENRLKVMESLLAAGMPATSADSPSSGEPGSGVDGAADSTLAKRPSRAWDDETTTSEEPWKKRPRLMPGGNLLCVDASGGFMMYYGRTATQLHQSPRYKDGLVTLPFTLPSVILPTSPESTMASALTKSLPLTYDQVLRLSHLYFHLIHPSLPIIDRKSFFRTLTEGPDSHPFRALLCCMLVVVVHHVQNPEHVGIQQAAYDELGKAAREVLIEYEAPHVWCTQAFLLLSLCGSGKGHGLVNRWRWTGAGVRGAQELGLHRDLTDIRAPARQHDDVNANEELRRRTWYGAYILERYASMATGRPMMISDDDCDTLWPVGYDSSPEEIADAAYLKHHTLLLEIAGFMLKKANAASGSDWKKGKVNKAEDGPEVVEQIQERLDAWRENLPPELSLPKSGVGAGGGPNGRAVTRTESLHITWHLIVLISRRSLLGRYDSECRKSSFALVEILSLLKTEDREDKANELAESMMASSSTAATNKSKSAAPASAGLSSPQRDSPNASASNGSNSNSHTPKSPTTPSTPPNAAPAPSSQQVPSSILSFMFVNVPLAFTTTWDALLNQVMAGDAVAYDRMERLHNVMEYLTSKHIVMRSFMGFMAETLHARGIKSRLRPWIMAKQRQWQEESIKATGMVDVDRVPGEGEGSQKTPASERYYGTSNNLLPPRINTLTGSGPQSLNSSSISPASNSHPLTSLGLLTPSATTTTTTAPSSSSAHPSPTNFLPTTVTQSYHPPVWVKPAKYQTPPPNPAYSSTSTPPPQQARTPMSISHLHNPPSDFYTLGAYPSGSSPSQYPGLNENMHEGGGIQLRNVPPDDRMLAAMLGDLSDSVIWDLVGFV